jgi:hypothetical protein
MDVILKLERDVAELATPAGRKVGTRGHDAAKNYLLGRMDTLPLQRYRGNSVELTYESGGITFSNLVAVAPGQDRKLAPILIGAHYDSVISSFCADDNAAAVAIALSAVESLARKNLDRDVVIALFDAEEPPYFLGPDMGSTRFYNEQRRPEGFHAALIMDLVGHDVVLPLPGLDAHRSALANLLFIMGAESHAFLPKVVRTCLPGPELPLVATLNRNVGDMSDHHIFRMNGVPYLFLSCGQWPHYHQATDTPGRLNYHKMAKIRHFVVSLCRELDAINLPASEFPRTAESLEFGVADTIRFEIDLIKAAFGSALPLLLTFAKLNSLAYRQDLDQLATQFQGFFRL